MQTSADRTGGARGLGIRSDDCGELEADSQNDCRDRRKRDSAPARRTEPQVDDKRSEQKENREPAGGNRQRRKEAERRTDDEDTASDPAAVLQERRERVERRPL